MRLPQEIFHFKKTCTSTCQKWELINPSEPVFLDGLWGKIDSWNWVGTKYGILSQSYSNKMSIFKGGIDFSSSADSCQIVCMLEMCWPIGVVLPPTHTTYDNGNSEIFSSFTRIQCLQETIPQQNWFLTRNALWSLRIWAQDRSSLCFLF
jgi:hypothetical protein